MNQIIAFIKMDGAGNDFIVLDGRKAPIRVNAAQIKEISARKNAVTKGADQLIIMAPADEADIFMQIYNADGSEVAACGNASRCIAWLIMQENGKNEASIATKAGLLRAKKAGENKITVDMGVPKFSWQEIPLSHEADTLHLDITAGELKDPAAVSMGNPHMVFFVPDIVNIDLQTLGPELEHHPLFPERANVGVAQIKGKGEMALRVFERGSGETRACGTGACAAVVAANRRGLCGKKVIVNLAGGDLAIEWLDDGHVLMTGDINRQFEGEIEVHSCSN